MRRSLTILALLILLVGCVSTGPHRDAFATAWEGQPEAAIIAKMGPPLRETTDGKGGHILVWEIERYNPLAGAYTATREAWVGLDGVIYKAAAYGL